MTVLWRSVNLAFDLFGVIILLIPAVGMLGKRREKGAHTYFLWIACCVVLSLLGDALAWLTEGQGGNLDRAAHIGGRGIALWGGACALVCFAAYVRTQVQKREGLPRAVPLCYGILLPFAALLSVCGAYAWAAYLLGAVCLVATAGYMLCHWGPPERRQTMPLALCALLPVGPLLAQNALGQINLTGMASVLSLLLLYAYMQKEQAQTLGQRALDLSKSDTERMLSQIQPHFLYNALVAVSQLCDISPTDAREMVSKFARYLKVNLDSLQQQAPIPFEDELDHTRIYLYIERKRFEERLAIDLDIRATDFRVPVLTLQPIVENAVRHGVTKRASGGTVRILSEDAGDAWRITVADDGVGFDSGAPARDGQRHVGIENVRSRLASVCAGSLDITSVPGSGTTATITIPKEENG